MIGGSGVRNLLFSLDEGVVPFDLFVDIGGFDLHMFGAISDEYFERLFLRDADFACGKIVGVFGVGRFLIFVVEKDIAFELEIAFA